MPRPMDENDNILYRARYKLLYPLREGQTEPRSLTYYFGPYRGPGPAKSAIRTETKSRNIFYYEREGVTIDSGIEVGEILWRPYHA